MLPGQLSGMIVVAQPGRMLASLRVLCKSLFPNVSIEQFEETSNVMQRLAGSQALLVLIDADLPGEAGWRLGDAIRQSAAQHHAVILAHTAQHNERACAAGLDALALEGLTAAKLGEVMDVFSAD
jgi:DNA-binding NarL/FixJ family response regulator